MIVTVWVVGWELDEDRCVLTIGDEVSSWLTFVEAERFALPAERIEVIHGVARPLPDWEGAEFGRHPVQIDVDGASLYWDAPVTVDGPVEVAGSVSSNNVDAPHGFPATRGVVRRVRMEWQEFDSDGVVWRTVGGQARYEEVSASYLPSAATEVPAGSTMTMWTGVLIDLETGPVST